MNSVSRLSGALIDGGVTDGKKSVFYSDVKSVETRKGSSLELFLLRASCFTFLIAGLWAVYHGISEGSLFVILIGILGVGICGFGASVLLSLHNTVVLITTQSGKKKLSYLGRRSDTRDLGREVAEILNRRKGGERGELPTDTIHFVLETEGKRAKFFEIKGDALRLFEPIGDETLACEIDLRQISRVERIFRSSTLERKFMFFGVPVWGKTESDVVFVEHSGHEAIHFVDYSYTFPQSDQGDPSEELVQAVNEYLAKAKAEKTEAPV